MFIKASIHASSLHFYTIAFVFFWHTKSVTVSGEKMYKKRVKSKRRLLVSHFWRLKYHSWDSILSCSSPAPVPPPPPAAAVKGIALPLTCADGGFYREESI